MQPIHVGTNEGPGGVRIVNVIVSGDPGSPTQTWLRDSFMPAFNEAIGDGVVVQMSGG